MNEVDNITKFNQEVNPQTDEVNNDIIDLSLSEMQKKSVRIDKDDNRILLINTSDLNTIVRLKDCYPKMIEMAEKASMQLTQTGGSEENSSGDIEKSLDTIAEALRDADMEMRGFLDYIFDTNVSEICAPQGNMYDPFNGQFRFEIIIEKLAGLFTNNIALEYRKMSARIHAHTGKYTGSKYHN